jgi:hypothetical protein
MLLIKSLAAESFSRNRTNESILSLKDRSVAVEPLAVVGPVPLMNASGANLYI